MGRPTCPATRSCQPLPPAAHHQLLPPASLSQSILDALLLIHKPECVRALILNSRLPGESDEVAAARWREVSVRGSRPAGSRAHPQRCAVRKAQLPGLLCVAC